MAGITVFIDGIEMSSDAFRVSIDRGKQLESDDVDAGTATIDAHNLTGALNPPFLEEPSALLQLNGDNVLQLNGDRILLLSANGGVDGIYGSIERGRQIVVKDSGVTIYTGHIEDVDYEWTRAPKADAVIKCADRLATLGQTAFTEWTGTKGQYPGERMVTALDRSEVGFPSGASYRDLDTGTVPLQADPIANGTGVFDYFRTLTRTEWGRLFASRTDVLTFRDRYDPFGGTPSVAFTTTGAGSTVKFHGIGVRWGTEQLHFSVSVQRTGGNLKTAEVGGTPDTELGVRNFNPGEVLYAYDAHSAGLAQFLLSRFSESEAVVSELLIKMDGLSTADRQAVAALEIGDTVSTAWSPFNTTDTSVSQTLVIEGVNYEGDNNASTMRFYLSSAADPGYFVLDIDALDGAAVLAP